MQQGIWGQWGSCVMGVRSTLAWPRVWWYWCRQYSWWLLLFISHSSTAFSVFSKHTYRSVPLIRPPILYTTSSLKWGEGVYSNMQLVSSISPHKNLREHYVHFQSSCLHKNRRRPGTYSTSSNHKVDSIMTYVDSVSVIMATCPHTLLHVLASTTEKSTN